jgi:uncharacterized protein YchJ
MMSRIASNSTAIHGGCPKIYHRAEKDTRRSKAFMRTRHLSRLLIVAILLISTAPLYAQAQPDVAKLKADAQKVVSIISGDKAKTQTFCQMEILGDQIDEAILKQDTKKAAELAQKLTELEKNLGPEYLALVESLRSMDLTSKDGQEIMLTFDKLDESCPR